MLTNDLKIELVAIDRLVPYARNSRNHSEEQLAHIAASIIEFGFTNPVLIDEQGGIIAGHGRVMAGRKVGLIDVPCIRLAHLTEAQKRAYVIADNKLAEASTWNEELLKIEVKELIGTGIDLDSLGMGDLLAEPDPVDIVSGYTQPPSVAWVLIKCPIGSLAELQATLDRMPEGCETYTTTGDEKDRQSQPARQA